MRMYQLNKIVVNSKEIESTCPVCLFMSRDYEDLECIEKNGACTECYQNFAFSDMDLWKKGKRPTTELARKKMGIHNYKTVEDGGP